MTQEPVNLEKRLKDREANETWSDWINYSSQKPTVTDNS